MSKSPEPAAGWLKVGDKLSPQKFGPFMRAHLQAYAAASGDDNPIHLDADMAHRVGLAAPPVHGMLVMSCLAPALANWRQDLRMIRLSGKFVLPLLRDDSVEISGRVVQVRDGDAPQAVLRLMAHGAKKALVLMAEATVVPREGSSS